MIRDRLGSEALRRALMAAVFIGVALLLVIGLAVSAQAGSALPATTSAASAAVVGGHKTHSSAGDASGAGAFKVQCMGCHSSHAATSDPLVKADAVALCQSCHDPATLHSDPATKQSVDAWPDSGDCFSCHQHGNGFIPVAGSVSLTVNKTIDGYVDLDGNASLSAGDRVHYRIDYNNPGWETATGVVLRDQPDASHIVLVDNITGGGQLEGTASAVQWNLADLAANTGGTVTYDALLKDETAFTDPSTKVSNTATLQADNRDPVTSSADFAVTVDISTTTTASSTATSDGATTSTTATTDSTTTATTTPTPVSSTTTTILPTIGAEYVDVGNVALLSADSGTPASASAVISVLVAGSPPPSSEITSTSPTPTTVLDPFALALGQQALGYDDLDANGNLSPGDRVHYRIDYGNPGPLPVAGALLRDQLDTAHVASVDAITHNGTLEEAAGVIATAIRWDIGALAAGESGFVTYDVVLRDALVAVRDGWYFPVQGPNQYSDDFGAPRYAGGFHTHQGNDILCDLGTPLVAVVGGIISRVNPTDTGLGGLNMSLHGDDGNSYYYAHLSVIQDGIAPGVQVKAGQVIGFAGNTGDARGGPVHLHFEIRPGGGPAIDPYLVLRGAATVAEAALNTASTTTTTTTVPTTDTTTTTVPTADTTTTTVPTTDTTATTVPTSDTTDTTVPSTDTTTTDTIPTTDTTTTSTPPASDTTTTTVPAPDTTTTTVPVAAAVTVFVPLGAIARRFRSVRRRQRRR